MGNSVSKAQETCDVSLDESSDAFRAWVDQELCSTQVINKNDSQTIVCTNTQPLICLHCSSYILYNYVLSFYTMIFVVVAI